MMDKQKIYPRSKDRETVYLKNVVTDPSIILRLSLRPVRAAFIAAPKVLKSYFDTGLFVMIIHPITFYCSPFCLDMSTLFYQLVKIIHITVIPFFGMVKIG